MCLGHLEVYRKNTSDAHIHILVFNIYFVSVPLFCFGCKLLYGKVIIGNNYEMATNKILQ